MSTKNKSAGTQFTPKGVTQGTVLVDPVTGKPVSTVEDSNGVRRIAVDGNFVAQNVQAQVNLDSDEDEVAVEDPDTGAHIRVEPDGSINANVEVDAADGDNIGLKVQDRNLSPSDTQYSKRVTAKTGTGANANTTSLDVSLHDHQGNEFTETNQFPTNSSIRDGTNPAIKAQVDSDLNLHVESHGNDPAGVDKSQRLSEQGETAIDGTYDPVNNTNPANVGVVTQQRNASASDIRQIEKPTSVRGTNDTTHVSMDVSIHDQNGDGIDSTKAGTKRRLNTDNDGIFDGAINTDPANIGIVTQQRNTSAADSRQTMRPTSIRGTGIGNDDTVSVDVALHDSEGNDFSSTNPLPVVVEEPICLEVEAPVPVEVDGVYNGTTNVDPDNTGLVGMQRAVTPDDNQQTERITAKRGTADTSTVSLDVSLHDHSGNQFTETNQFPTNTTIRDGTNSAIRAKVSNNNDVGVSDVSSAGGVQGAITVGTTAVEVKVGGSSLANRKFVTLHNNSLVTWFWGYTNSVSTTSGTPLFANQFASWRAGTGTTIFVIAATAGNNGRVTEAA